MVLRSNNKKAVCVSTDLIPISASRDVQGSTVFTVKLPKTKVVSADSAALYATPEQYHKRKIPATGSALSKKDADLVEKRGE